MSPRQLLTENKLKHHPRFIELEQPVQEKLLGLLKSGILNEKGDFKRSANPFIWYRAERGEQIKASGRAYREDKLSRLTGDEWKRMTSAEKAHYKALADADAESRLASEFAVEEDRNYKPDRDKKWDTLSREGRTQFWFDLAIWRCLRLLDPSKREPQPDLSKWVDKPNHKKYLISTQQPEPSSSNTYIRNHREAVHPHSSRSTNGTTHERTKHNAVALALDQIKFKLVFIGPKIPGGLERTLMLASYQLTGNCQCLIYVEGEITADIPQFIVCSWKKEEEEIRKSNNIILWGFKNPAPEMSLAMSKLPVSTQSGFENFCAPVPFATPEYDSPAAALLASGEFPGPLEPIRTRNYWEIAPYSQRLSEPEEEIDLSIFSKM